MPDNTDEQIFDVKLNGAALKIILALLDKAYRDWPGGDPEEQLNLQRMRTGFYKIYMECVFNISPD